MIVLVLVVLSLGSLVTGYLTDEMVLVEVSFGLSVLGAALLVVDAIRKRRAKKKEATVIDEPVEDAPALVVVVPGRRRYHEPDCESVGEADVEELTAEEAADEGFSPCSRCHPTEDQEEEELVSAQG
ncbi:hypothetical protein GCM10027258_23760 [Amycolatopsis stemonae]